MAQTYISPLDPDQSLTAQISDLDGNQDAQRSSFSGTSAPTDPAPVQGQFWWDETNKILNIYNGTLWLPISSDGVFQSKSGAYTILSSDGVILADASGGDFTLTLPAASTWTGKLKSVVNVGASGVVTVDGNGAETVSGVADMKLFRQWDVMTFKSDGTNVFVHSCCISKRHFNTTPVGNVGGGTDDLIQITLPGGRLFRDGMAIRITAWGTTANNSATKSLSLLFGATTLSDTGAVATVWNNLDWRIEALVTRTGAATQQAISHFSCQDSSVIPSSDEYSEPTETLSGNITVKCQGSGTSDDDVLQKGMMIEVIE